jgi:hypothetical protein
VHILNLSTGGVLLESAERVKPGALTEVQLLGAARRTLRARVNRCRVTQLNPLRYEAALVFDQRLDRIAGSE